MTGRLLTRERTLKNFQTFGVLPATTRLSRSGGLLPTVPGMEPVDLASLGLIPGVGGGDRGYHSTGDLLTQTVDGVDLNALWGDYQDMLAALNTRRDTLLNFLVWRTTKVSENFFGTGTQADFEEASEYGEPVGVRPKTTGVSLGYAFKWWDIGARYTWQFLADATAQQVDSVANMVAEADNRNVFMGVMKTLFNNTRRTNKEGVTVFPFYSGVSGDLPAPYGQTTFADSHNHYVTSGAGTVDSGDLDQLQGLLTEHGYKAVNGYKLILLINEAQENTVRGFRSPLNGGTSTFDFIPSQAQPTFLLPTDVRVEDGAVRPPAKLNGLDVVGSYGQFIILKNEFIPAGYMVGFATGGEENVLNPIGIREHTSAGLRGLRLVKGKDPDYPLIDSFWTRGFGTGVRTRGAGAIMQITAAGSYAVPAQYAW